MTMAHSWVVLDTNIWIFGLRADPARPACMQVLQHLPQLYVHVPRQILLELRANLTKEEMGRLFRLVNRYPERIQIHWEKVETAVIHKYRQPGCKLGDATVAAHVETLEAEVLVSENRDFLAEITGLPFRVASGAEIVRELGKVEEPATE
ncbi:MAG: type II toxin-antitoxin system VapC family toxin [Deltaproteobacteria bacterium]|nr:type II toxin-antitoxin system VapC family toxin [Deltaproteobacteria bacterium]